ncbi:uncharacterized protein [Miscanthus floridulus]|uniref:uncharacterized protein n=1 Tax=Miscanthus floridulus TaxID=154761 RepID=UPI00345A24E6
MAGLGQSTTMSYERASGHATYAWTDATSRCRHGRPADRWGGCRRAHDLRADACGYRPRPSVVRRSMGEQVQRQTQEAQSKKPREKATLPPSFRSYPDWIILARRAFISDRQNAAVAVAGCTSDGNPIEVFLFAADPPAASHLRVYCPGRNDQFSSHNPAVIFSRDDLILFEVCLDRGRVSDYFIYRAHPRHPSLLLIPDPDEPCSSGLCNTGIVRCGADHFAVVALYWDSGMFNLTVFSSRTGAWTTRVAPVEPSEWVTKNHLNVLGFKPTKVIPLKGSLLGWADLWGGIMFCDILSDDPRLHYIPMPEPMPGNLQHKGDSAFFRDVIGCGEVIKFVEVEYDADDDDDEDELVYKWIAVTRSRKLDSAEWGRAHEVSSEDVTVKNLSRISMHKTSMSICY